MSRYIDADKLMSEFYRYALDTEDLHIDLIEDIVNDEPTADVVEAGKWCDMHKYILESDYIKREDALSYPLSLDHYDEEHGNRDFVLGGESYREYIKSLPSADVVEVVRCKYCKHGKDAVMGNYKYKLNLIDCNRIDYEHPYLMRSDDYCSYGERADT